MGRASHLRKAWDSFLQGFKADIAQETEGIERAIGFIRLREQLWDALDNAEETADAWAWPIDIFVDDDNSLFAIVAQSGKLYQIPITVTDENMSLGSWTQVTEVFKPVQQSRFTVKRQKDGRYRFVGVAATSVLNRVAEIDSTTLFDSFVEDVEETGNWPRVDFYHLGRYNEDAWEFGTVDFHAREGFCYVVSGLFDEDHPLATAAIRAYEEDPEKWGFSIEFYAFGEPEVIVVEPEVRVPVYTKGRIIRVSIVKECDAASLFTRVANVTEETVRMKRNTVDALAEFFGTDDAAKKFLESFEIEVDGINRSVDDDNLVHRAKKAMQRLSATDDGAADPAATTAAAASSDDNADDDEPLVLDEAAIGELARQVAESPTFKGLEASIAKLQKSVDDLSTARAADHKELTALKTAAQKTGARVADLAKDEQQKKTEYQQDMPAKAGRRATFRPRDENADEDDNAPEDLAKTAERTLAKIPNRY